MSQPVAAQPAPAGPELVAAGRLPHQQYRRLPADMPQPSPERSIRIDVMNWESSELLAHAAASLFEETLAIEAHFNPAQGSVGAAERVRPARPTPRSRSGSQRRTWRRRSSCSAAAAARPATG